jgi:intein/homing endonuclease
MPDNIEGINAGTDAAPARTRTRVSKTASTVADTARKMARTKRAVIQQDTQHIDKAQPLTANEKAARGYKKYATTTFGFNSRQAYSGMSNVDVTGSSQGNFYSPQLSTDFLEKPQNLRERRAWYRNFYNSNEFVGQAVDLHSTLPISKIKLDKPKAQNQDFADYIYDFFVNMCSDIKLTKILLEISHEYSLFGNCVSEIMNIRSKDGYRSAKDIKVGDYILTNKNRFRRVLHVFNREAGDVLEIKVCKTFEKLECTSEHPVEVLRGGQFLFIPAGELTKDDYIRVTWPDEEKDIQTIDYVDFTKVQKNETGYQYDIYATLQKTELALEIRNKLLEWLRNIEKPTIISRKELSAIFGVKLKRLDTIVLQLKKEGLKFTKRLGGKGYQKGSQVMWYPIKDWSRETEYDIKRTQKVKVPPQIKIDEDFCYLSGYWLGDGTLGRDKSRSTWGRGLWQIAFGNGSETQIPKIESILINMFGKPHVKKWSSGSITYLKVINNPAFIEWWSKNFGETSHGKNVKKIPQWFADLPVSKLKYFLAGIVDSDGCVSNNENGSLSISMSSKRIMDIVRDISFKCGAVFNYRKAKPRLVTLPNGNTTVSREMYNIYTIDEESNKIFTKHSVKQFISEAVFTNLEVLHKRVGKDIAFKIRSIDKLPKQRVINFEVEEDHTFQVNGFSTHNCFCFMEDHDPYSKVTDEQKEVLKEQGKAKTVELYEKFKVIDKDPNYKGFRKIIILPPDQVRIKKVPLSDEAIIEFVPDPETKKTILGMVEGNPMSYDYHISDADRLKIQQDLPEILFDNLKEGGAIPLDTDPYSGSHVFHLSRKKSQYETYGVSMLERCVNTLLYQDKLRQSQTSIASRHMTPMRLIWAEDLSDNDTDVLREQVDLSLTDPDYSVITNYEVHWQEMGSNGRLLELSSEYEHNEGSLFAGLGVTREILTGEGTYAGNRINLEILNTQYMLFREQLQEFVENNLFKPVAMKKGFKEIDKFGNEKLIYPHLSFSRLAIRDNDAFFDQAFNLYNKGSLSIDIIHDMMNIDTVSTKKKLEADLFTVNDSAFNQLLQNLYTALGPLLAEKFDGASKIADYLGLNELPAPPPEAEGAGGAGGAGGGLPGLGRFSSTLGKDRQAALVKLIDIAIQHPQKLDVIAKYLKQK